MAFTAPRQALYSKSRSGETPARVLADTMGELLVDGYSAYNKVTVPGGRGRARPSSVGRLRGFHVESVTTADDVQNEVSLEIEHATGIHSGRAMHVDIAEGTTRAIIDIVNRVARRSRQPAMLPPDPLPPRPPLTGGVPATSGRPAVGENRA